MVPEDVRCADGFSTSRTTGSLATRRKDGRGLNDNQRASPSHPHPREPDLEDPITARESRSGTTRPFEDVDLLSRATNVFHRDVALVDDGDAIEAEHADRRAD